MADITITMKSGEVHKFRHEGRAGGSYTKEVKFENGWVIVKDEWDKRTAFPAEDVSRVDEEPRRGW